MQTNVSAPVERAKTVPFYINRNFVFAWSGQFVSLLGDFVFDTTLLLWVTTIIGAGQSWVPLAVSGLLLAEALPGFLVGPFAGVFVDRWALRSVLLAMDAARALLVALLILCTGVVPLPFVAGGHLALSWQLGAIYVLLFLTGLCSQFFNPARITLGGDIVPEIYRARATGFVQSSTNLALIIAPALAAPLFFLIGLPWLLLFNALSFLFSFSMLSQVHFPQGMVYKTKMETQARHFWREFGDGIRCLVQSRALLTLLITMCLVLFSAGMAAPLGIFFATQNLHISANLYGLLDAASGVGLVIGAVLLGWFGQRIGLARLFAVGTIMVGGLELLYARQNMLWLAGLVLVVQGLPNAAINVAFGPLVLKLTPRAFLGRVFALILPAMNTATLLSTVLTGYLVSTVFQHIHAQFLGIVFGPYDTLISLAGLLSLAAGILALCNLRGVDGVDQPEALSDES